MSCKGGYRDAGTDRGECGRRRIQVGTTSEAAMQLVEAVSKLPHIKIRGLMTIAPFTDNPEDNRIYSEN